MSLHNKVLVYDQSVQVDREPLQWSLDVYQRGTILAPWGLQVHVSLAIRRVQRDLHSSRKQVVDRVFLAATPGMFDWYT